MAPVQAPSAPAASYSQATRPMEVITPLGKDVLLLTGFTGFEAISQLFSFQLEMIAPNQTNIPFEGLLGQKITVRLDLPTAGQRRYFNGLCVRVSQGARDSTFTSYRMEIVPQFWLLTRKAQIRIFQHMTVPDILKKVFTGMDVVYQIQGTFQPRDYCVQYRETDFNFASRLMEEEGFFYFFTHTADGHKMVVANTPQSHPDLPVRSNVIFEGVLGGTRPDDRIIRWEKMQELRSGKFALRDHAFGLAHKWLSTERTIQDTVSVGKVTHQLKVANNEKLELYDYPGEYAQRFDDVTAGGGDQAATLQEIFQDNQRTVNIRMEQEAVQGLVIQGLSTCRQFTSGHKFQLQRHFNADGEYVLTSVQHEAANNLYRSDNQAFQYQNTFTCIPLALPFRPPRVTPKPFVQGTQTALVVGPPGEEIYTDKYGRVKVQFHWDRDGNHNADSSCWIRVNQPWGGKNWGIVSIPRIGQEVIVDFEEGDPDRPLILGNLHDSYQMPAYPLPDNKTRTWIKSNTSPGGDGYNEMRFEDKDGKEDIWMHAERDMDLRVQNDYKEVVGSEKHMTVGGGHSRGKAGGSNGLGNLFEEILNNKHQRVDGNQFEKVAKDKQKLIEGNYDAVTNKDKKERVKGDDHQVVNGDRKLKVDGDQHLTVGKDLRETVKGDRDEKISKDFKRLVSGDRHSTVTGDQKETVNGEAHWHVVGELRLTVDGDVSFQLGGDHQHTVAGDYGLGTGGEYHLQAKDKVVIEAKEITLKGEGGFIKIDSSGVIIQGTKVKINSGGSPGKGKNIKTKAAEDAESPKKAEEPKVAQEANPTPPKPALDDKPGPIVKPSSFKDIR